MSVIEQHNVPQSDRFSNPFIELEAFKFQWLDYIMKIIITTMYVVSKYVPETYSRKIILKVKKLIYQSGHFFLNNGKAIKVKKKKEP